MLYQGLIKCAHKEVDLNATLYLCPGLLLVTGEALDAGVHSHHALQVVWPVGVCELALAGVVETAPVVLAAGVEHRLTMSQGLVMLVEPQSDWGERLAEYLDGQDVRQLVGLPDLVSVLDDEEDLVAVLRSLANALEWSAWEGAGQSSGAPADGRIARLLERLDGCFRDQCVKPDHWRASEVAAWLNLSESWFLHLFREQMGIAWRPYLLWRRLLCAVNSMSGGRSATEAAHEAGFSDSAHLSRTFSKSFGLSIRQALAIFR